MTYNEFEQRVYNCYSTEEVIKLCVKHPDLAKEFVERHNKL